MGNPVDDLIENNNSSKIGTLSGSVAIVEDYQDSTNIIQVTPEDRVKISLDAIDLQSKISTTKIISDGKSINTINTCKNQKTISVISDASETPVIITSELEEKTLSVSLTASPEPPTDELIPVPVVLSDSVAEQKEEGPLIGIFSTQKSITNSIKSFQNNIKSELEPRPSNTELLPGNSVLSQIESATPIIDEEESELKDLSNQVAEEIEVEEIQIGIESETKNNDNNNYEILSFN